MHDAPSVGFLVLIQGEVIGVFTDKVVEAETARITFFEQVMIEQRLECLFSRRE